MDKEQAVAEIMSMFRFYYKDDWAPDNIFAGRSRVWIAAFNELVEKGFITKKKHPPGFRYRWAAAFPENY